MYEQIREDIIFVLFYGVVTAMALIASLYLLFRRANAIAPDITPPVRLRRWTSAFLMVFVLNHVWFMPTYFLPSGDDAMMFGLVGVLLDSMTFFGDHRVIGYAARPQASAVAYSRDGSATCRRNVGERYQP